MEKIFSIDIDQTQAQQFKWIQGSLVEEPSVLRLLDFIDNQFDEHW